MTDAQHEGLRRRGPGTPDKPAKAAAPNSTDAGNSRGSDEPAEAAVDLSQGLMRQILSDPRIWTANQRWLVALLAVAALSLATRMWQLQHPNEVVFDEVHFGKFASYYLRRTYFFDVHPPLGKLLLALVGYFMGYDGQFLFDNIGDKYEEHGVPYIGYRLFTAFCGAVVPIASFVTLQDLGVSLAGSLLGAAMIIFDTALVAQSRLILLDSMLLMFGSLTVLCWVRFFRERRRPFERAWWLWLLATGVGIACTAAVKLVGLLTMIAVGVATLCDLWRLLDWRRGGSLRDFARHFGARALALIAVPLGLYLAFFYVHFAVLCHSGPGDSFMSPGFRATLTGNEMTEQSLPMVYGANVTFRSVDANALLHSHVDRYPLRYEDKRVSSQGQQVTGYHHKDPNNIWVVEAPPCPPAVVRGELVEALEKQCERLAKDTAESVQLVQAGDLVRLRHVLTNSYLLTHDVASPRTPTNMEMTVQVASKDPERLNETLWRLDIVGGFTGKRTPEKTRGQFVRTKVDYVQIQNAVHDVCVYCNKEKLPEWGFGQLEINGNVRCEQPRNRWFADSVAVNDMPALQALWDARRAADRALDANLARPSFLSKFLELHGAMIHHNSALIKPHPFMSAPITWPVLTRGISFWENKTTMQQVYLIGNPLVWWFNLVMLGTYVALWIADRIFVRRGSHDIPEKIRVWWDRAVGFLFMVWLVHYAPYFTQGRALFLHHYFPSFVASSMLSAALVDAIARLLTVHMSRDADRFVALRSLRAVGALTVYSEAELPDGRIVPKARRINELRQEPTPFRPHPFSMDFGLGAAPPLVRQQYATVLKWVHIALVVALGATFIGCFFYFSPLAYGTGFAQVEIRPANGSDPAAPAQEGITVDQLKEVIRQRKWLKQWDFLLSGR